MIIICKLFNLFVDRVTDLTAVLRWLWLWARDLNTTPPHTCCVALLRSWMSHFTMIIIWEEVKESTRKLWRALSWSRKLRVTSPNM